MNINTLRKEIIGLHTKTLNPKSKWYAQDLADFRAVLSTKTEAEMRQQLANMRGIAGLDKGLNKILEAEEKRMAKAGMYDLGNMKPENALD